MLTFSILKPNQLEARAVCYAMLTLTTGIDGSQCPLPHAFDIDVFKINKSNSATIKHIYNESYLTIVALLLTSIINITYGRKLRVGRVMVMNN